jgi:hypothetical protein
MRKLHYCAAALALSCSSAAIAQVGSTVPPSKNAPPQGTQPQGLVGQAAEDVQDGAEQIELIGDVASDYGKKLQSDGAFMASRTGRILGRHELGAGEKVIAQGTRLGTIGSAASTGAGYAGTAAQVVGYGDKLYRGDVPGLMQSGVEDGLEFAVPKLMCGPAAAACGVAYSAGSVVGGGLNSLSKWVSGETLQDHMTDVYYSGYEKAKHALYPETDPDSEEFANAVRARAAENRAKFGASSAAHAARNEEVAEQRRQEELDRINQIYSASLPVPNYTPLSGEPVSGAAPASAEEDIDPATGCHRGHDEGSHPGGCRDYSRGEPTSTPASGASAGAQDPSFVGPPAPPKIGEPK